MASRPGPLIQKQGFVKRAPQGKLSAFKKWEKKWLVFAISKRSGPVLDFFDDRSDMEKGPQNGNRLLLTNTKQVCAAIECKVPHTFLIITEEKVVNLAALNERERDEWIKKLRKVLTERDCLESGSADHQYETHGPKRKPSRRRIPTPPSDPEVEAQATASGYTDEAIFDSPPATIAPAIPVTELHVDLYSKVNKSRGDSNEQSIEPPPRATLPDDRAQRGDTLRGAQTSEIARENVQKVLDYYDSDEDVTYETGNMAVINGAAKKAVLKKDMDAALLILSHVQAVNEAAKQNELDAVIFQSSANDNPYLGSGPRVEYDFSPKLHKRVFSAVENDYADLPTTQSTNQPAAYNQVVTAPNKFSQQENTIPNTDSFLQESTTPKRNAEQSDTLQFNDRFQSDNPKPTPRRRVSTKERPMMDLYGNVDDGGRPLPVPRGSSMSNVLDSPTSPRGDQYDDIYENALGAMGYGTSNPTRSQSNTKDSSQSAHSSRYNAPITASVTESGRQITRAHSKPLLSESDEDIYDTGMALQAPITPIILNSGDTRTQESAVDDLYEDALPVISRAQLDDDLSDEPAQTRSSANFDLATSQLPSEEAPPPYTPPRLLNNQSDSGMGAIVEGISDSETDSSSDSVRELPPQLLSYTPTKDKPLPLPNGQLLLHSPTADSNDNPQVRHRKLSYDPNYARKSYTLTSSAKGRTQLTNETLTRSLSNEDVRSSTHSMDARKEAEDDVRRRELEQDYDTVIPVRQSTAPLLPPKRGQTVKERSTAEGAAKRPDSFVVKPAPGSPMSRQSSRKRPPLDGGELLKEGNVLKPPVRHSKAKDLPLKQSQIENAPIEFLQEELNNYVRISMYRGAAKNILFVDVQNYIWVAGWNQKKGPLLHNLIHVGDRLHSVNGEAVTTSTRLLQLIKRADSDTKFEIVVKRLPFGKAYFVHRNIDDEEIGLQLVNNTAEICGIIPGSLCAHQGLKVNPNKAFSKGQCHWILTEINHRPLSVVSGDGETATRLAARGKDITFVVQPQDLVDSLKRQLKNSFGWRDYLLS